jgi:hypothetical protein
MLTQVPRDITGLGLMLDTGRLAQLDADHRHPDLAVAQPIDAADHQDLGEGEQGLGCQPALQGNRENDMTRLPVGR